MKSSLLSQEGLVKPDSQIYNDLLDDFLGNWDFGISEEDFKTMFDTVWDTIIVAFMQNEINRTISQPQPTTGEGELRWVKCSERLPGNVKRLDQISPDAIIRRIDNKALRTEYFILYGKEWGLENFEWLDEQALSLPIQDNSGGEHRDMQEILERHIGKLTYTNKGVWDAMEEYADLRLQTFHRRQGLYTSAEVTELIKFKDEQIKLAHGEKKYTEEELYEFYQHGLNDYPGDRYDKRLKEHIEYLLTKSK